MHELLGDHEISNGLAELDGWERAGESITKSWERKGFNGAMQLANVLAYVANQTGHHPDILVHGYNHVTATISTHAVGGITQHDFELARRIEHAVNS